MALSFIQVSPGKAATVSTAEPRTLSYDQRLVGERGLEHPTGSVSLFTSQCAPLHTRSGTKSLRDIHYATLPNRGHANYEFADPASR